jgi:hypothetical protein
MAFTGDLEHLHIVDIIQLLNTTRKSGTLSVRGSRGESQFIFSNGYIVGASHLHNRIRIGAVLVKMNALSREDLAQALEVQRNAGQNRKPLIITLIEMGKLGREEASRGLKKLIEMTLVDLIGWSEGTFTLDTDIIDVSPECGYPLSMMEQEISIDAQMILMDALRIYDERERDRQSGRQVLSDEEYFADVIASGESPEKVLKSSVVTAEDLGLGDIDHLERKLPQFVPATELFDPLQIHRQKIRETLSDFSAEQQEDFVSFLEKSTISIAAHDASQRQEGRARGLILFSGDELIRHSIMTICKDDGVLVFATDAEEELDSIIEQCLTMKILPVLVFDEPQTAGGFLSREKIIGLRQQTRKRYPALFIIQLASPGDFAFMLQSYRDGVGAVFPKPPQRGSKAAFISDAITFLGTFKSYISGLLMEPKGVTQANRLFGDLKERILALRVRNTPSSVSLALLQCVSDACVRAVTFIVRPSELVGERAIGVYAEKNAGPIAAARLRIPLTAPSVFREVLEKGLLFCGVREDEVLKKHLFEEIGAPRKPLIILLPMKYHGKTVSITYGDFGEREAFPLQTDALEILAEEAGLVLENALYRRQFNKASLT